MSEKKTENLPVREFRAGSVRASVWKNEGKNGDYFTVTFQRVYRDEKEEWQTTNTFRPLDMGDLIAVAMRVRDVYRVSSREPVKKGEE